MCTPTSEEQAIAGEDCRPSSTGMFFINTNAASPYALGRITASTRTKSVKTISFSPLRNVDPFLKEIDLFGKLEGNFNNLPYPKFSGDNSFYFTSSGSDEIAHNFVNRLRHQGSASSSVNFVNVKARKSSKLSRSDGW